jgi:hypothetical protein
VDDLCELLEEAFVVSAATIADDRLVVAGTGPQGPVVRVYALADTDRCAAATLLVERRVAATPIAVSAEGDDVFFIAGVDQTNSGGALFHLDLRDVELLLPAGAREVTGAARAAAAVVVSMAPRVSGGGGLLVIDTGSGAARELAGAQTTFQPAVVSSSVAGRDVQVAVSVDVDAVAGAKPRLVARALDGSVTASLDAALVAQGPGFDVLDARRFARDPIIAAADDRLAVLGYDGAGRRTLDVLTLAGTAEVGRVTLEGTLPDGALALDVIGDVVVVGFEGDGRAFLIDAGALSEVTVGDDEAIVGAASDALVVAISAGDLLVAKPPSTMRLVRRDPRGVLDDVDLGERLPSALFGRAFARVIDDGDGVRVYDQQADPPVAWRLKPGGLALPLDGALRPLASAMPRLGRSAASADLLVRETATGAALYRQR